MLHERGWFEIINIVPLQASLRIIQPNLTESTYNGNGNSNYIATNNSGSGSIIMSG